MDKPVPVNTPLNALGTCNCSIKPGKDLLHLLSEERNGELSTSEFGIICYAER